MRTGDFICYIILIHDVIKAIFMDDSPHGGILLITVSVCTYVCTYVRVWLNFLVKVSYWFKLYLMPSKHFRWTVYMLNFDIKINLDEFYFFNIMLFLVFGLSHFPY